MADLVNAEEEIDYTDVNTAAFTFVQELAGELNRDALELPSFPDAVIRIRKALEDENCTVDRLARIAGSEPALAGRLLKLSNSALLQRGANQVTDLRTAIGRLGYQMVRNAAISVAMEQMFSARKLGPYGARVKGLWEESTKVSALCLVLARKFTKLNPDEAFLCGLMHNVGKLYILTRASKNPDFLEDTATLEHVLDQWHGPIGSSIIENWGFSESQAKAAEFYLDFSRKSTGRGADHTDVVQVAAVLANYCSKAGAKIDFELVPGCRRLGLDAERAQEVMEESNKEIRALAEALKG